MAIFHNQKLILNNKREKYSFMKIKCLTFYCIFFFTVLKLCSTCNKKLITLYNSITNIYLKFAYKF